MTDEEYKKERARLVAERDALEAKLREHAESRKKTAAVCKGAEEVFGSLAEHKVPDIKKLIKLFLG